MIARLLQTGVRRHGLDHRQLPGANRPNCRGNSRDSDQRPDTRMTLGNVKLAKPKRITGIHSYVALANEQRIVDDLAASPESGCEQRRTRQRYGQRRVGKGAAPRRAFRGPRDRRRRVFGVCQSVGKPMQGSRSLMAGEVTHQYSRSAICRVR